MWLLSNERSLGRCVKPFFTEALEGYDINDPNNWPVAEHIVDTDSSALPAVDVRPHPETETLSA